MSQSARSRQSEQMTGIAVILVNPLVPQNELCNARATCTGIQTSIGC